MPMLQEFSTHLIIPEPSEELIPNEPWSIEIYADGLMDDLFADIDDILDGSSNLSSHTVRPSARTSHRPPEESSTQEWYYSDYESLQTLNIPQIVLPNTLNRTVQGVPQVRHKQASTVVVDTPATVAPRKPNKIKRVISRLVILGTAIGVAIAGTIYILKSGASMFATGGLSQSKLTQTQLPTRAQIEADLADYMLGALTIIDKQADGSNQKSFRSGFGNRVNFNSANTSNVAYASTSPVGNLPSPLTANSTPPIPNRSATNVVERIYVPIYPAPSPMRLALPRIPGSPLPAPPSIAQVSQPNAVKNALNTVKQPGKPVNVSMLAAAVRTDLKPVAVKTAPIAVRPSSSPISALPVAPLRPAPSQVVAAATQLYVPTNPASLPTHTLEGLLELGNKSAALFKVDGVTRRVNVGETIGTSGWTLVDVNNGEAIVRRNGEVRSIYAGQKL